MCSCRLACILYVLYVMLPNIRTMEPESNSKALKIKASALKTKLELKGGKSIKAIHFCYFFFLYVPLFSATVYFDAVCIFSLSLVTSISTFCHYFGVHGEEELGVCP